MHIEAIKTLNIARVARLKESPNSKHKDELLKLQFGEMFTSTQIHAEEPMEIDWHTLLLKKALVLMQGLEKSSNTLTILGDVTTTLESTFPLRKLDQTGSISSQIMKPFEKLQQSPLVTMTEDAAIMMELDGIMLASAIRTTTLLPSHILSDYAFVQHLLDTSPSGLNLSGGVPGGLDNAHTLAQIAETNKLGEMKLTNLFGIPSEVSESLGPTKLNIFKDFFDEQGRITGPMLNNLGLETTIAFLLSAYNFHPTLIQVMLKRISAYAQTQNKRVMLPSMIIEPKI